MTEQEWMACADPEPMLTFLRGKASDRKLRLFAVAQARQIWHLIRDGRSREAVEIAERYADGLETSDRLVIARNQAVEAYDDHVVSAYSRRNPPQVVSLYAAVCCTDPKIEAVLGGLLALVRAGLTSDENDEAQMQAQAKLVADIFGPLPFRSVLREDTWLTPTVIGLAESIYAESSFDGLPVLADALEEASCRNEEVLNHCRNQYPRVRGCWCLDLILGKEQLTPHHGGSS